MPVYANIGGTQKQLSAIYANVGGAQKQLSSLLANVGGVSQELMAQQSNFWTVPHYTNGTMATNSRTRMVADSVTVASNGTFTLVSPSSKSGRPGAGKYYVSIVTNADNSDTTGTTLYYALNANGAYRGYDVRDWETSSSDPSTSSSSYGNVDAVYDGTNLLVNKTKISSFYRWTQKNIANNETVDGAGIIDVSGQSGYGHVGAGYSIIPPTGYALNGNTTVEGFAINSYGGYWYNSGDIYNTIFKLISTNPYNSSSISFSEKRDISFSQGANTGKYMIAISSSAYPTYPSAKDGYYYTSRTTIT